MCLFCLVFMIAFEFTSFPSSLLFSFLQWTPTSSWCRLKASWSGTTWEPLELRSTSRWSGAHTPRGIAAWMTQVCFWSRDDLIRMSSPQRGKFGSNNHFWWEKVHCKREKVWLSLPFFLKKVLAKWILVCFASSVCPRDGMTPVSILILSRVGEVKNLS